MTAAAATIVGPIHFQLLLSQDELITSMYFPPALVWSRRESLTVPTQYQYQRLLAIQQQQPPTPLPHKKKRVMFAPQDGNGVVVIPIASPLDLFHVNKNSNDDDDDNDNALWYGVQELTRFRDSARESCRQMRMRARPCREDDRQVCLAQCGETRGLESRSCLERQRRKYLAIKCIVQAQVKFGSDPDRLGALAQKCTRWAAALAQEEGARDYARAHMEQQEEEAATFVTVVQYNNHKRASQPEEDDQDVKLLSERRVRPKLAA